MFDSDSEKAAESAIEEAAPILENQSPTPAEEPAPPPTLAAGMGITNETKGGETFKAEGGKPETYQYQKIAERIFGIYQFKAHVEKETGVKPTKIQVPDAEGRGKQTQIRVPKIEVANVPADYDAMFTGGTAPAFDTANPLTVPMGQETFDIEGSHDEFIEVKGEQKPNKYFSRKIHWPGNDASGVTIGRGYDMGNRSASSVKADLIAAGVPEADATKLSAGAGPRKKGNAARDFVKSNEAKDITITHEAQYKLFMKVYHEEMADAVHDISRFAVGAPKDTVSDTSFSEYEIGFDWSEVDPKLMDLIVDLAYRGDLKKSNWKKLEPYLDGTKEISDGLDEVIKEFPYPNDNRLDARLRMIQ